MRETFSDLSKNGAFFCDNYNYIECKKML